MFVANLGLTYDIWILDITLSLKFLKGGFDINLDQILKIKHVTRETRLHKGGPVIDLFYRCRIEQTRCWYSNRISYLWNSLPCNIRNMIYENNTIITKGNKNKVLSLLQEHFRRNFRIDAICTWKYNCNCYMCRVF